MSISIMSYTHKPNSFRVVYGLKRLLFYGRILCVSEFANASDIIQHMHRTLKEYILIVIPDCISCRQPAVVTLNETTTKNKSQRQTIFQTHFRQVLLLLWCTINVISNTRLYFLFHSL